MLIWVILPQMSLGIIRFLVQRAKFSSSLDAQLAFRTPLTENKMWDSLWGMPYRITMVTV